MEREFRQCDVLLVSVPFGPLNSPSLALATLKGQLHARGITAVIRYAGFEFARRITYSLYSALAEGSPKSELLAGEWVFCQLATPQSLGENETYEKYASAQFRLHHRGATDASARSFLGQLRAAKMMAEEYAAWLARSICQHKPRIVGFTSTFQQHQAALAVIAKLKTMAPDIVLVMGGANCEGRMGLATLRRYEALDAVFSGEADETFPEFCSAILGGHAFAPANGVLIRGADGRLATPSQLSGRLVRHLDENPIPEFDDYFSELADSPIRDEIADIRIPFETSRGCWWGQRSHCTFCGLNGSSMQFRSKSTDRAIAEIHHLLTTYGNRPLAAVDNIIDHSYLNTVVPRLKERIRSLPRKPQIFFETKSNLSREQVWALSDAGINEIQPGIESLNSDILRLMRKGVSSIRNIALLKYCAETETTAHWNLLHGFPGETPAQYREMVSLLPKLWHLYPPAVTARIRIDRFSPYFIAPADFGLGAIHPAAAYKHIYGAASTDLGDIAYFFETTREAGAEQVDATAITNAVGVWKRNYEACDRFYTFVNGRLLVCMFSPEEPEKRIFLLNETQAWLFSKCIQPASRLTLRAQFEREWLHPEEQLFRALDTLVDHDIVLFRDGYYLALPLELGRYQPRVSALHALKRMLDTGDVIEFASNGEYSTSST